MNLKHLLVLCALFGSSAFNKIKAQIFDNARYCVEAGVTASKISNIGLESTTLISFRVGANASVPISLSNFYVSSGLFLTQKGEYSISKFEIEQKLNPTYLIIPLDLSYKIDIDENGAFYINAGPYMGIGIIGSNTNYNFKSAFDKDGLLNRYEVGIGLNGSVEYNNFIGRIGGEIGLSSALNKNYKVFVESDPHNFQIYFTLGYRLFN